MSKLLNALVGIVHTDSDSSLSFVLIDLHPLLSSIISLEDNFKGSWLVHSEISGFVLISKGVPADDDWLLPSWNEARDVLDDDRLPEDCTVEDVSDGAIGTLPHLLEFEFLDSGLIGSDGRTLDAYLAFLDGFSSLNGDFVISGISVLNAKIEVLYVEIEEREDELVLDGLPDDSGHLVSI